MLQEYRVLIIILSSSQGTWSLILGSHVHKKSPAWSPSSSGCCTYSALSFLFGPPLLKTSIYLFFYWIFCFVLAPWHEGSSPEMEPALPCPLQWKLRVLTSGPPSLLIHYPGWGLRLCPLLARSHSLSQSPHQAAWSWVGDGVQQSSWPEWLFLGILPASLLGDSLVLPGSTWLRGQSPIVLHREGP